MKLTILMYHKVDALHPGVRVPGNFVSPQLFARQMDALVRWGYRTITFEQWLDHRHGGRSTLPRRPLIVTFDDGYTCFDRNAWPILRERGLGAMVFLVASQIGGTNAWDRGERSEPLLDAPRIRALEADGVAFGSHTVTHRPLARVPRGQALDEMARSRAMLADVLGRSIDVLAYPFSNQNRLVRGLAREAGYRCAVRGKGRMNWRRTDPFGLRRIKVEQSMSVSRLRRVLLRERYFRVS